MLMRFHKPLAQSNITRKAKPMEKRYLNWQGETIDEISESDFATSKEYRAEKRRLLQEYALAGMSGAYWSQRPFKGWN